jgi:hypothetical protein
LVFFGGFGAFQRVTGKKIKKFFSASTRAPGCVTDPFQTQRPVISPPTTMGSEFDPTNGKDIAPIQLFVNLWIIFRQDKSFISYNYRGVLS